MKSSRKIISHEWIIAGVFFITHFIYFSIFNRYHLAHQESMQLFRYDWNYFIEFLSKPGGISEFSGAFLTQFFLNPIAGALIVTLAGLAAYFLSAFIFRKFRIFGIFWSLIPVMIIAALQSDHFYTIGYTIGFLICLSFIAIYVSIQKNMLRYATGFTGWFILYLVTGGFSLLASALCIIYELFFTKKSYRFIVSAGYALDVILLPYLAWRYIYYFPYNDVWLSPILFPHIGFTKYLLLLLLVYYPCLLILMKIWLIISGKTQLSFGGNWKTMLAGIVIFSASTGWIMKNAYDYKTELFFGILQKIQQAKWDQVLKLSSQYPGTHLLVLYSTNLALYKTGQLGDRMFAYNQVGPAGLSIEWQNNNIIHFFGSEIFFHLGNNTEAYRWAFGAMIIDGPTPPILKRLALTSIIKGDYEIAKKYLYILDQSLFYRKWADHYLNYLANPELIVKDQEISEKRHLLIHADYLASASDADLGLIKLLENHPDNKMAFEYYMAMLLLNKNILEFTENIARIKDFGFTEIPVHYEEALLWYMGYSKRNIIPEGYTIRKATIQSFKDYFNAYSTYSNNPKQMAKSLNKSFGKTFWYYYHFNNIQVSSK